MAIYARCCKKDYSNGKRKCVICGKNFTKFVVRVKDSVTGKVRTKTLYSFSQAKKVEAKFKADAIEGRFFDKKEIGFIDFEKYTESAKLHKKTWFTDYRRWENHIKGKDYLTPAGINKILCDLKNRGYSPASVDHVYKLIRLVINWHIQNGFYHQHNPCRYVKAPRYDNRVTNYLSKKEVIELLDYLRNWDNIRASLIIQFALFTGRRKSEITDLKWDSVDLTSRCITCKNTKNGKTVTLPLNKSAFDVIVQAKNIKISEYVFPSSEGKNYYNGIKLAFHRMKKRLKLSIRFHDLRHTYATHLASSGKVDIFTLKTLLTHQDITLTMRYAHLTNKAVRNANNVMDELF